MSSAAKACGTIVPEKWISVPDVNSHCVNEVAKLGVTQFNKIYDETLKFEKIYEGWFRELAPKILNYKLHIKALDFLGRSLNFELLMHEEKTATEKKRNLISITVIVTIGHHVGNVKPPAVDTWIKIPNLLYPFIQTVAKFSVDEHNKLCKDSLTYESIVDGWFAELGLDGVKLKLHVRVKDCLGRIHKYEAIVRIEKLFTLRVKTLLSFNIIENWIKIPDVKKSCVQVVAKFAVEWVITHHGNLVKLDSVYDGWYLELGPNSVKFRLWIRAVDILGRLLNFQIIVVQKRLPNGEIVWTFISITVLLTPGHLVVVPPPSSSPSPSPLPWVPIPNISSIKFWIELAKWVLEWIKGQTGDYLVFDVVLEAFYRELGFDNIEIRITIRAKDCIGRVVTFEAIVKIENFNTTKVQACVSYKVIKN